MQVEVIGTQNYGKFRFFPENREINESYVKKLMKKISKNNLLRDLPILVDDKMRVIDGQHRLEAAKRIGATAYYKKTVDTQRSDIMDINSEPKGWNSADVLKHHIKKDNKDYIKFKEFMDCYGFPFHICYRILCGKGDQRVKKPEFKNGMFSYPSDDIFYHEIAKQIIDLSEFFKDSKSNIRLVATIMHINQNNSFFRFSRLMRKLEVWTDYNNDIVLRSSLFENVQYLNEIYNYHERKESNMVFFKRPPRKNRRR